MSFVNNFKCGRKIILNFEPYNIEFSEFINPGKGKAFVRLKLRRLLTGTLINKTFKASEHLKSADIIKKKFIYLYNDNKMWIFMDDENFNQIYIKKSIIGNNYKWLIPQDICEILLWNNNPINIILKNFVKLKVIKTENVIKGDSVSSFSKFATLSTGVIIKVPLFIKIGDIIKIDTRSETYISRDR
ncbi:elongation factor P [Buchnera aphidicola]|uniref:elongation factor P n=1 Tax=Buchnera aphidicola TaxID=9 RepID=UPI0031B857AC